MKKDCTKKERLKIGVILALFSLSCCLYACSLGNAGDSLFSDYQPVNTIVEKEPMWERCTVRVINYAIGTELYVLCSNGEYSIYGTPAICSLSAFLHNQGNQSITVIETGTLSTEALSELNTLVAPLISTGEMLPIKAPEGNSMYRIESIDVFVSVDDLAEAHFLKNYDTWEGYPPKEYDELLKYLANLYPNSSVLIR